MKRLLVFVGVLLLVLVVAVFVVASQAGGIIKTAVEELGPQITGTEVKVADVHVSLLSGEARIKGFMLGNPAGYKSDQLAAVNELEVLLDVNSLFSDAVHVKKVLVEGAQLTYELAGKGSNLSALQKNIEANTGGGEQAPAEEPAAEESSTKVIIDQVLIKGTKIKLAASLLGGEGASIILPDIELNDVGKEEEGGSSPADVVKKIFTVINKEVIQSVGKVLPTDQIQEGVDKGIKGVTEGLGKGLKSLFGKDKEE